MFYENQTTSGNQDVWILETTEPEMPAEEQRATADLLGKLLKVSKDEVQKS